MRLIDTHCHLNFKSFNKDFLEVARRSEEAGVKKIILVGSDLTTAKEAIRRSELINKYFPDFAYSAVGIHPVHSDRMKMQEIAEIAESESVVALGEAGLDFYHDEARKTEQAQIDIFKQTIELAIKLDKPLIIHNRLADNEIKGVIEDYPDLKRAVFHCFSTDHHFAAWALEKGFFISFTGNITYGNKKLKKVIERTPIERIMVETDAPYIVPEPLRSEGTKRCEPYMAVEVIKKIVLIKNIDLEKAGEQIYQNSIEFFGLC